METQVRHNPGVFKQQNKAHKTGRHRSKGEILKTNKGKVGIKVISRKLKDNQSKETRKNRLIQIRKNKREEILNKKRSIGGINGSPHIVSIIPLSSDVSTLDVINVLNNCDEQAVTKISETGNYIIESQRFKSKYNFLLPNPTDLNSILDAIKVTDTCVFVLSNKDDGIDSFGQQLYDLIYTYHLPTSLFVVQGIKNIPQKAQSNVRDHLEKSLELKSPGSKLITLDTNSDGLNLLHKISQHKLNTPYFNEMRPYLIAERYEYDANDQSLKLYGYLRSRNLSANQLVHLPGLGTYQLSEIYSLRRSSNKEMEEWELVEKADQEKQEGLEREAVYDEMNAEQTWPTEQELKEAEKKVVKKKVPKGTSDYQAAWILDSEEEEVTDDEDEEDEDEEDEDIEEDEEKSDEEEEDEEEEEEEMETISVDENNNIETEKYDQEIDMDEEKRTLEKIKAEQTNKEFPDQIDTPLETPARVRFQKYRGLKSFRTSPWDKYENLPSEYSRIFQFEDIKRTVKKVTREILNGAEPGNYVRVHLKNVPPTFFAKPGIPIVMYGLLKHENKMSIMNIKLKRVNLNQYNLPIKSKESLIFHVGCRRFEASAIFSQHTSGDKHKFERFMPSDSTAFVSTLIAPITFPTASALVFKKLENGQLILIAQGALLSMEPHRIVLKRIVLSGHPFRVSKKNAVVRYMFFNPEDVNWFSPVELRTRWGRRGHIKETLGTHGHMKCQFNGIMKSQDTVFMNLYKRVYPKWNFNDLSNDFILSN